LTLTTASTAGGRGWIHPRFQFDGGGRPYPEIALVLEAFGDADPAPLPRRAARERLGRSRSGHTPTVLVLAEINLVDPSHAA
jgi:hypothetical protein